MALTTSYLITTKNVEPFLNSIISARAPERFTQKFLESLEFKSTNDRLFIALLKGLGFIDEAGTPTARYYDFMDQTRSKEIMAQAVMEAYEDLFNVNTEAYKLTEEEVKNKLRTLTQGKHTDRVLTYMAKTFKSLSSYAAWGVKKHVKTDDHEAPKRTNPSTATPSPEKQPPSIPEQSAAKEKINELGLHYNIQIHLPETRDAAVYDAIFQSLKTHLL